MTHGEVPGGRGLTATGLLSAGVVLAEVAMTRLLSVTVWYHFSFVAVSLAMLGMASAAIIVQILPERIGLAPLVKKLPWICLAAGLLLIAGEAVYLSVDYRGTFMEDSSSPFRLVPTLLFLPGFSLAGIAVCVLLSRFSGAMNRFYFADLLAAGVGGASAVGLLDLLSGPLVVASAGVMWCAAGGVVHPVVPKSATLRVLLFLVVPIALVSAGGAGGVFDVRYTKEYDERGLEKVYEKWSALARVTVMRHRWFRTDRPYGWGLSSRYSGAPVDEMWLEQDASAGSPIVATDGHLEKLDFLEWDVTALAYALAPFRKVAVIGLGGGRDALTALRHGSRVWGIEINRDIADLLTNRFREYVAGVFNSQDVDVIVADGRTFMERTDLSFDLIQISLIDSWAASAAGAYVLAENNLYTREAFMRYLDRLEDDGILTVSRWALTQTPGELLRLVSLSLESLKEKGVQDPSAHLVLVRSGLVGTLLVKKSPFEPHELAALFNRCTQMDFEPLYMPGYNGGLLSVRLVVEHWRDLGSFLDCLPYDFSPPTDDRPFFFLMLRPWDALTSAFTWDTGLKQNFVAVQTLHVLFLALLLVVALIVLLPARVAKRSCGVKTPLVTAVIFLLLGLAFMLVEIPLIHRMVLVLGHPIYALSVVLSVLLVSSGIGAYVSRRLISESGSPAVRLTLFLGALAGGITVLFGGLHHASGLLLGLSGTARFGLVVACTAAVGLPMGFPFPSLVHELSRSGQSGALPWLWAVNGAASVLGSVLAFALALAVGFTAAACTGAVCYLTIALLIIRSVGKRGENAVD